MNGALRGLPAVDVLARRLLARRPELGRAGAVSVARAVIAQRRAELLRGAGRPDGDDHEGHGGDEGHRGHEGHGGDEGHRGHEGDSGGRRGGAGGHSGGAGGQSGGAGGAGHTGRGEAGVHDDADLLARALDRAAAGGPPRVLNATGVLLHTNLGRAPLARSAADAVHAAALGAVALELDLATGRRGRRGEQAQALLCELTGGEDALVVNNGAAAALLCVAALAGDSRPVLISRGELLEIGGGFRIPEVIAQSGARLVEVGTTNRTRIADYQRELCDGAIVLRVHRSNFRMVGFTESPTLAQLVDLGAPLIHDAGSGALQALGDEPLLGASVAIGAALTCCSGDKLLGGPQAGIIVGRADAVAACRRHPLARALRVDRLTLAALGATLALHRDPERARRDVPALAMLHTDEATLARRAAMLATAIGGEVIAVHSRVGGGALPLAEPAGPGVALPAHAGGGPDRLLARLRAGEPPLLARITDGRVVLDPRTLTDSDAEEAARVVQRALQRVEGVPPACALS